MGFKDAMEASEALKDGRRLTLFVSAIALITNALIAITLQQLPYEPWPFVRSFVVYSVFAAALSVLGAVGAVRSLATPVLIFSNHLLFDALISTVPRLGLLPFSFSITTTLCSPSTYAPRAFRYTDAPPSSRQLSSTFDGLDGWLSIPAHRQRCEGGVGIGIEILFVLLTVSCIGQWWCAWRVRNYAKMLGQMERFRQLRTEAHKKDPHGRDSWVREKA